MASLAGNSLASREADLSSPTVVRRLQVRFYFFAPSGFGCDNSEMRV